MRECFSDRCWLLQWCFVLTIRIFYNFLLASTLGTFLTETCLYIFGLFSKLCEKLTWSDRFFWLAICISGKMCKVIWCVYRRSTQCLSSLPATRVPQHYSLNCLPVPLLLLPHSHRMMIDLCRPSKSKWLTPVTLVTPIAPDTLVAHVAPDTPDVLIAHVALDALVAPAAPDTFVAHVALDTPCTLTSLGDTLWMVIHCIFYLYVKLPFKITAGF